MRDKNERRHRRTTQHAESVATMANADFSAVPCLSAAMGLRRCIHGCQFPCAQCRANRINSEHSTGRKLSDVDFELLYAAPEPSNNSWDSAML